MLPGVPWVATPRADRQVFLYLIRTDVNVRRRPDDTLEMDSAIMTALKSYEVGFHLMPLPKQKVTEVKPQAPTSSKGKAKGKNKRVANFLPQELQNKGCVGVDDHNRRLCFNSNMNQCQAAANGAECQRGFHLCLKKGCHAPHSAFDHEKDKGNKP